MIKAREHTITKIVKNVKSKPVYKVAMKSNARSIKSSKICVRLRCSNEK